MLCGCTNVKEEKAYSSVEDFEGKTIGVVAGSMQEMSLNNYLNNVSKKIASSTPELLMLLKNKQADAVLLADTVAKSHVIADDELDYLVIPNSQVESGFAFSHDTDVVNDFNSYLNLIKSNGYLDYLKDKWVKNDSTDCELDVKEYKPSKRKLSVAAPVDLIPYSYEKNGELIGLSIDLINDFGYQTGYEIDLNPTTVDGMLSGVASGKYEIGATEVIINEKRKESMQFSDPLDSLCLALVFNKQSPVVLEYNTIAELNNKDLGCMSGSIFDQTIEENIVNPNISYFNSRSELIMGLQEGKIEGYLADEPVAMLCTSENEGIGYIKEGIDKVQYGLCFASKAAVIREQFDNFIRILSSEGKLEELKEKWICADGINAKVDKVELTGENGVIECVTTPDAAPFSFFKDNEYRGYEVELLTLFAKEYGYSLDIKAATFDALLSSVASDKFDIAFNGIYITEERKKSVDFSIPTYEANVVAVVRNTAKKSKNFIENIKDKFYATFVEEDRYKLIINGVLTTLNMINASIIFGTIFGFIFFLLAYKFKVFKKIFDVLAYFVSGLPVVVLLMILFYIVFAKTKLSGTFVSIVGFTLIFGCSVYGMLKTGVDAIDVGQFEAALALGYTENKTLFKFIFPQAFRIVMPTYEKEIVQLIKSSSIVGYVTVQDITRVSDIIRSRTYDAFFPLIVTAVIYFIVAWILMRFAKYVQKELLPAFKSKKEILKSVGQKDK